MAIRLQKVSPIWQGQEVFIIGGGTSLKTFDFNLLKPELTIGCNDAYLLGEDICDICVFGDKDWFDEHEKVLSKFGGLVFTNTPKLQGTLLPWLFVMGRRSRGLHYNALGWNYNTGAVAINLALLLGAKKIYLLGFDMKLSKDGRANWHKNRVAKPNSDVYVRFNKGWKWVEVDWKEKFSDREIINVTNDSGLNVFPKVNFDEFWKNRIKKVA